MKTLKKLSMATLLLGSAMSNVSNAQNRGPFPGGPDYGRGGWDRYGRCDVSRIDLDVRQNIRGTQLVYIRDMNRMLMDCRGKEIDNIEIYVAGRGDLTVEVNRYAVGRRIMVNSRFTERFVHFMGRRQRGSNDGLIIGRELRTLDLVASGDLAIDRVVVNFDMNRYDDHRPFPPRTGREVLVGDTGLQGRTISYSEFRVAGRSDFVRSLRFEARDDSFSIARLTVEFDDGSREFGPTGVLMEKRSMYMELMNPRRANIRRIIVEGSQGNLFGTKARLLVYTVE